MLLSFLPLDVTSKIPFTPVPPSFKSELLGIQLVPSVGGRSPPDGTAFCQVMAGTTNDMFREWCFDNQTWSLPFNAILVEVTFGGVNASICHGAGFESTTLSDLVVEVRYVDAQGALQVVNDPEELRLASGAFGMLGVVTSLTLQLVKQEVAVMMPVKTHVALTIPPPKDYTVPSEIQTMIDEAGITPAQLEQARLDFIKRCEEDYYLEWFWFPYQTNCWVNTWKSTFRLFLLYRASGP